MRNLNAPQKHGILEIKGDLCSPRYMIPQNATKELSNVMSLAISGEEF